MKRRSATPVFTHTPSAFLLSVTAAALLSVTAGATAAPLNIKPGAWDVSTTIVTSGLLVPKATLDAMKPAQRAKLEASMRERDGKPETDTSKQCLTQKDLAEFALLKDDDASCKTRVVSQTPAKLMLERECAAPAASKGTIAIDIKSSERFSMKADMARESGKVLMTADARWIGASCEGLDNDGEAIDSPE